MASIFFVGVPKVSTVGCLTRLCKITKNHNATQVAFMMRVAHQQPRKKPAPFPYWKKEYNLFYQLFDPMTYRFDDNTQIVIVDGPPAVGKTKLCEELAKEFGLLYMPAPTHEQYYINTYGFDTRELDPQLPHLCKSYDLERFHQNPTDTRVAYFQLLYYLMRFEQYTNCLLHLLSTGQGVVLNRSVYSDFVFATAMANAGYISKDVLKVIMSMKDKGMRFLLKPHLLIYLDVPVKLVQDKIRQRGNPSELNSKALTSNFLSDIEKLYKEKYLKEFSRHSHLLIYDWSKPGDFEDVVEDIEALDFDNNTDGKLDDWIFPTTSDIVPWRRMYDINLYTMYSDMYRDDDKVDWPRELYWDADELTQVEEILENCPTEAYDAGYNPFAGDNILFKSSGRFTTSIRRSCRDFDNRSKYMS